MEVSKKKVNAAIREDLQGFARNSGVTLTDTERRLFMEDVQSYTNNFGISREEAEAFAWEALISYR